MFRREFLLSPLSLFGFVGSSPAQPKEITSEWGLGKYKAHHITYCGDPSYFLMRETYFCSRYLEFPIESKLVIEYEKGLETYTGFNIIKSRIKSINEGSIEDLLKFAVKEDNVNDRYSTLFIFPEISPTGEKFECKMRMSMLTWTGPSKDWEEINRNIKKDEVPAMLQPGEYIISKNKLKDINN
jgi:hypothetical protein